MSNLNVKLLNVLVYVTSNPAAPFSVISATRVDIISCALCFKHFYHPGPRCLPPLMRKLASSILFPSFPKPYWPFLGWFWPGTPQGPGRSLHPSEPHTQSQSRAGAIPRNFRSMRSLGMEKMPSLTYVLSFIRLRLCSYFTVLEIQEIHNSFGHWSFAWNNKVRKWERGQPEGTKGSAEERDVLSESSWHLNEKRAICVKENFYLSLRHFSKAFMVI